MRGVKVTFPADLKKVATIDDGLVEGIMTYLGVIDKVSAIGSWSLKRDYNYDFETDSGVQYSHQGLNTMRYLHPTLNELPCFNSPQGDVINFEVLANAAPELVILRIGDCTVGESETEKAQSIIDTINSLGIPLVVIYAPGYFGEAQLKTLKDEIEVVGDVFGMKNKASELYSLVKSAEDLVRDRTSTIADKDKSKVLYLGLNPDLKKSGAMGAAFGIDTPESFVIEKLANATNAFQSKGHGVPLNLEKIYVLDPDVIILPTYNGYHPPRELYEAAYFKDLRELRAISEKRVYALPWTPMNCARRLEYPLDILITAKAAYPERFKDINVYQYALEFYQKVYGIDETTAKGLRSTQILDWMADNGF
ncbi:MAG: ABC transporter substrate-binding protein [Deltaproteobacteria bacterium]|nr:ABC transporter substrate-binding protein [Deltaproteobacteria bacterium]